MKNKTQWQREENEKKLFPPCTREEKDCASIDICEKCRALDNTDFDRPCPFYHPWTEVDPRDIQHFTHNGRIMSHRGLYFASSMERKKRKNWTAKKAIREAREASGLELSQVARVLGITQKTYQKLEDNPEAMSVSQARKLARLLGLDAYDIFAEV